MASDDPQPPHASDDQAAPQTGSDFKAPAEERLVSERPRVGLSARVRFALVVLVVLLVHAAFIAAFLMRDRRTPIQLASSEETPVEVVVEQPPEPPKPLPPPPPPPPEKKPPPPPPPKEDLSPAYSAPRKENQETLKTDKLQDKTSAPNAAQPPQEGTPSPKAAAAPPKEAAPPTDAKEATAGKEEDNSKPDAEALDKATPKSPKLPSEKPKTKAAKAQPKTNQKTRDVFASLSSPNALPELSFSKPAARTKVYGGTEDVRWMSTVEGMLEEKVGKLPRTPHWQAGGVVAICFHVDVSGRVTSRDYCQKSGYPDVDAIAMRALLAAVPFPPPPPGVERGLIWVSKFDGQLPTIHISKR